MYSELFIMPKAVYFQVLLPIFILIIAFLIYYIINKKNKGTYYYTFHLNYVICIMSLLITSMILSLMLGYSLALGKLILLNTLAEEYYFMLGLFIVINIVLLIIFFVLVHKLIKNLNLKKELDNNVKSLKEVDYDD